MSNNSEAVRLLAARRWTIALVLTAGMLVVYFGFILMIAFGRQQMAIPVTGGLTVGIVLGVLVIVFAWVFTWIYVHWANHHYDPALAKIRGDEKAV